jgi:hypothetical protein
MPLRILVPTELLNRDQMSFLLMPAQNTKLTDRQRFIFFMASEPFDLEYSSL